MAAEIDSQEASQLRALLLGYRNNELTQATLQSHSHGALPHFHATTSKAGKDDASWEETARDKRQHRAHDVISPQIARNATAEPPRYSTSRAEPPTIILDSSAKKMTSDESQGGGDTQPLSQSVYDQHMSRSNESKRKTDSHSNGINAGTPHTYRSGETGHIDLLGVFEQPDNSENAGENGDDVGGNTQVDVRAEIYPESKRFQVPKTPATNGKKRDYRGVVVDSVGKTPGLPINPFVGYAKENTGVMALSQVFRATQAASSPSANLLPSDAPSERPSPAMYSAQRPSTSASLSSPAKMTRTGMKRAVTEPQTTYISMQQSQAERERRAKAQATSSPAYKVGPVENFSDDEFELQDDLFRRRANYKKIKLEVEKQFAAVTARPRPGSRIAASNNIKGVKKSLKSSSTMAPRVAATVIISDDEKENLVDVGSGNDSEDETQHEEEPETPGAGSVDELAEDNKENFDVRNGLNPMRTPKIGRVQTPAVTLQTSPARQQHIMLSPHEHEVDELAGGNETIDRTKFTTRDDLGSRGTQPIAIVDSQPSQFQKRAQEALPSQEPYLSTMISPPKPRRHRPYSPTRPLPHTSQIDSSMARRVMDEFPLEHAPSNLPRGQYSDSHKVQLSWSPLSAKSGNPAPLRINSDDNQNAEANKNLSSSPPPILREPKSLDSIRVISASAQNQEFAADESTTGPPSQSTSERLPTLRRRKGKGKEQKSHESSSASNSSGTPYNRTATLRSTIPETSSVVRQTTVFSSSHPTTHTEEPEAYIAESSVKHSSGAAEQQYQSKSSTLFETARTHLVESPTKPRTQRVLPSPNANASSSRRSKVSKVRKFTDIAANPSPLDEVDEVDMDIGLMTGEDLNFQSLMEGSSPVRPAKRRRRAYDGQLHRIREPISDRRSPPLNEQCTRTSQHGTSVIVATSIPCVISEEPNAPLENRQSCPRSPEVEKLPELVPTEPAANITNLGTKSFRKQHKRPAALKSSDEQSRPGDSDGATAADAVPLKHPVVEVHRHKDSAALRTNSSVVAPNRVLAQFKGNYPGYYPATCLAVINGGPEPQYKVRFDDGTIDIVTAYCVKRLELQIGDGVKVDVPGERTHNYTVRGFRDKETPIPLEVDTPSRSNRGAQSSGSKFPPTDIYGHKTIMLAPKQLGGVEEKLEAIPLTQIYLTQGMWKHLKDREFSYQPSFVNRVSGLQTPSDQPSTPSSPGSRMRRVKVAAHSLSSLARPVNLSRNVSRLFENMVFSITNVEEPTVREKVVRQICSYGGNILDSDQGFAELFDVPALEMASPRKGGRTNDNGHFQLTATAVNRGFTCLLADRHCRNAKYIQALALGIPCLATRWVKDCISKGRVLPWEPYLLPSGESAFLGGATRARLLPPSDPEVVLLSTMVESRPNFLADCSILLIIGKGKGAESMKAYPFIAHALGARKVSRALNLEVARQSLLEAEAAGEAWDWVYYYEGENRGEKISQRQAENTLFGGGGSTGKKRKRGEGTGKRKTRVAVTEYVIQSLILGQLMDDE
ncbi:MAG: hypothetical protein Q9187_000153 [Circinaria calcarea]